MYRLRCALYYIIILLKIFKVHDQSVKILFYGRAYTELESVHVACARVRVHVRVRACVRAFARACVRARACVLTRVSTFVAFFASVYVTRVDHDATMRARRADIWRVDARTPAYRDDRSSLPPGRPIDGGGHLVVAATARRHTRPPICPTQPAAPAAIRIVNDSV